MRRERNDARHWSACPQEDIILRIAGAKKAGAEKPAPEEAMGISIEMFGLPRRAKADANDPE